MNNEEEGLHSRCKN